MSDNKGNYSFRNLKLETSYKIQFDFIGYRTFSKSNLRISQNNPILNLGTISLSSSSRTLKGVTVQGKREILENRLDKMVYNAELDLNAQTGSATDVLKNVPQISVDIDGNIELAGSPSIRFLINGKPSAAFGNNVADVLQTIPASQIKSIEVITNPGAKYDGQGLGGIINIVLKKNNAEGIHGNLALTAGTRNENGSFNLNYKKGNFGINSFLSGNYRPQVVSQNYGDQFKTIDSGTAISHLHQNGPSQIERGGLQSGIGFDWSVDTLNTLSGSINFDLFGRHNSANTNQITKVVGGFNLGRSTPDTLSRMNILDNTFNQSRYHNFDMNLDWKHKFKKEDEELEFYFSPSFGIGSNDSRNQLSNLLGANPNLNYQGDSILNPGTENEIETAIDFTNPLQKGVVWGIGAKLNTRSLISKVQDYSLDTLSNAYGLNPALSYQVNYHQQVYGFYSEISFPIQKLLDIKLGLRYQRTEVQTYFSNAPNQSNPPGYNSYLPSIFLSHKFEKDQILKLSFSRRIEPPGYNELNPYINITDPNNLTRGNPLLLPETADRFELAYSKSFEKLGSLTLTSFFRTSNNDIQPYSKLYSIFNVGNRIFRNVNVITAENVGYEKDAGFNIFTNFHLNEQLDLRTNSTFYHRSTVNYIDSGMNAHSLNYRINLNITYSFNSNLSGEFSGSFNSSRSEVQGHYPSFTTYILGFRKSFWNKKGSLALVAGNFLNRNVNQTTTIQGINFTSSSTRIIPYRTLGLNFSWKFGKIKFKKDKEEKTPTLENSPDGN